MQGEQKMLGDQEIKEDLGFPSNIAKRIYGRVNVWQRLKKESLPPFRVKLQHLPSAVSLWNNKIRDKSIY